MKEELLKQILTKLDNLNEDIKEIRQDQQEMKAGQKAVKETVFTMKIEQQDIKSQLNRIETKLSNIPPTYESYESHMAEQDRKIKVLNDEVFEIKAKLRN